MSDAMRELRDAYAALPDSVAGDAAPEGATLADRIRALTSERDRDHRGWSEDHRRWMAARALLRDLVRVVDGSASARITLPPAVKRLGQLVREFLDAETPGGATPGGATPGGATPGGATPGGATPGGATPEGPGSR